jgi:hypothetical protein
MREKIFHFFQKANTHGKVKFKLTQILYFLFVTKNLKLCLIGEVCYHYI